MGCRELHKVSGASAGASPIAIALGAMQVDKGAGWHIFALQGAFKLLAEVDGRLWNHHCRSTAPDRGACSNPLVSGQQPRNAAVTASFSKHVAL
jgi:hypothetical protein